MKLKITLLACCASLAFAASVFADGKDYHDQDLKQHDFTSAVLNGADFTDAVLDHANFQNAVLKKAIFKGASVEATGFTDADVSGADFTDSKGAPFCMRSHFDKAIVEGITFNCSDCSFRGAKMKGCKIQGYIYGCDFSGADLRGANLRAMKQPTDPSSTNRWKGAIYDDDTAWPDGFDPKAAGAVMAAPVAATAPADAPK